jgi:hypothetical protein
MAIPEAVPNPDRLALIAFMMLETGGADWPKPELPKAVVDPDRSNRPAFNRQMAAEGFSVHERRLDHPAAPGVPAYKGRMLTYRRAA